MPQIKYTKSAWDNLLQVQYHLLDEMLFRDFTCCVGDFVRWCSPFRGPGGVSGYKRKKSCRNSPLPLINNL